MKDVVEETMIQQFGIAGLVMHDRGFGGGKRAAATATLKEQLIAAEAEKTTQEARLAELLVPLQAANDRAHAEWLRCATALEKQRVQNQSATSEVNNKIAELRQALNTPLVHGRTGWTKVANPRPDAM